MALTMNEETKNRELAKLLEEEDHYTATTWANLMRTTPKLLRYAVDTEKPHKIGTSNLYCYIGLSTTSLNIVTLHSLDVTRTTGYFRIPLEDIQQAEVKKGVLKSSAVLSLGSESIRILWFNEATGTDMKNQRKYVRRICDYFLGNE